MPKILFLINSLTAGGAEKVITVLLNELNKEYKNIELVCLEKNDFYILPDDIKVTYLSDFEGNENSFIKLLYLLLFAYRLAKLIKNNNITLVQSHLYRANYVNILAKFFGAKHKKQLVTAGKISRYKTLGLSGKINLFLIKHLYSKADLLISKTHGMQNDMQQLFNFKNKKVIINNPYDINQIIHLTGETISDFEFEENKKYIISVGRLIALKRNSDLIHTLTHLTEDIHLIFLGDGDQKNELMTLVDHYGLASRVHFLGRVQNPYKYIAKADLFINCSESEGFPNVLVEAMICKTPVISTDCISGPREILAPNTDINLQLQKDIEMSEYGILFPIGSIDSLTRAINLIFQDNELRENYIKKASNRATHFSVNQIITEYKKVLGII